MSVDEELPPLSREFADADLGDQRRTKRLGIVLDSAAKLPGASLPVLAGSDSALEGTYRFLGNEQVRPESVLAAHQDRTVMRAAELEETIVAHDTTQFRFPGEIIREGLGCLNGKTQGFLAHYALALGPQGRPLGVLALRAWTRSAERKGKRSPRELQLDPNRESLRWHDAVDETAERLAGRTTAIHVMDREADSYELFSHLREQGQRFVIRVAHDRPVAQCHDGEVGSSKLYSAMADGSVLLQREVRLSRRADADKGPKAKRIHPSREARKAQLVVRARTLLLSRSKHLPAYLPAMLELNFVDVHEPEPPAGQPAVRWRLVTTEPIDTPEQVARVIDLYRHRWQIEEFFKAIKTGCAFEKRQLESAKTLLTALVVFSAVAWRLLLVRWMGRHAPHDPGSIILTPTQLDVLRAVREKAGRPLPESPTSREILYAIAALGVHLRSNGNPGWQVLGRGFDKLLILEEGWLARAGPSQTIKSEM